MKKIMAVLIGSIFTVTLWSSAAFADGTATVNTALTSGTAVSTTNAAISTTIAAVTTTSAGVTAGTGTNVSITPDNIFYSVKRLVENIQVALTFSPEGKAELFVTLADKRLAEADIMVERNKQELVEQVMKAYVKTVSDANEKLEEAAKSGSDVKATLDDIRIIEQTADKLVIRATGVIPAGSADALKTKVADQVKATLAVQAFTIARADMKDANTALKAADSALETAQKSGDQTAIKAAEANQQAAQQAKTNAENVKNQVEAYKNEIVKAVKDNMDEKSGGNEDNQDNQDENKDDENENGHKLSPEELQAMIAHMQAIIDKQQQKRAEQIAKHSGQPGNASAMISKNADKQLAKAQARIDALKAQLSAAQAGPTTDSGITAGRTAATSGAITSNNAAARNISGDENRDKDEIKAGDHKNGKGSGKIKNTGKSSEKDRNNDNEDQNENED